MLSLCEIHNHALFTTGCYLEHIRFDTCTHTQLGNLVNCDSTESTAHWLTVLLHQDRARTYSHAFLCKKKNRSLNGVETEINAIILKIVIQYVVCFYNWWVTLLFKSCWNTQTNKEEEDSYSLQQQQQNKQKTNNKKRLWNKRRFPGPIQILYAEVQPVLWKLSPRKQEHALHN